MSKEERLEQLHQDKELKQILSGEINENTSQEPLVALNHWQNESDQDTPSQGREPVSEDSKQNATSPLVELEEKEPAMPLVNSEEGQPLNPLTEPHKFQDKE